MVPAIIEGDFFDFTKLVPGNPGDYSTERPLVQTPGLRSRRLHGLRGQADRSRSGISGSGAGEV